ncbi:hypothetical protein M408DRAFT_328826 [Serendipita vermifera MAFF 305830]|uniref:Golgi apparatus membrane protein TVP38 n=1 Tax=Serendipita vermifera MAFF 305830 TaxID=933852 RepID=A0A0C3BC02_SERVB|nr:hypothetical protein M408DRAFT_328826 [Serendipita vermifera MAFF 305830]
MAHESLSTALLRLDQYARAFVLGSLARFRKLSWRGKLFVVALALFNITLVTTVIIVGPEAIFQYFYRLSQKLKNAPFGWLISASLLILASFPPMIGFYTMVSITGFAWGLKGMYIAGPGALVGAGLSFLTLRLLFHKKLRELQQSNKHWRALDQVVAARGLPLIILIRLSPIPPWVYSTALFASITSVKFWQFIVANLFLMPKIFLTVFVASRIAALADKDQRGEMDTTTKILNYASVALGIIIGVGTGWVVYRLTQQKIRELPEFPREIDDAAADALLEAEQGAPLLRDYSPEPEDDDEPLSPIGSARKLGRDEGAR